MSGFFRKLILISFLSGVGFSSGAGDRFSLTLLPRVETGSKFGKEEGYKPNFGFTTFYTNFSCHVSDKFGIRMNNRWLSTHTADYYTKIGNTRSVNWLDILDFSYNSGRWHFDAGKLYLRLGGFEFECPSSEFHHNLMSNWWMNIQPYTWGVAVGYDISHGNRINVNVHNSPFSGTVFNDMLLAYSLSWDGQVGPVQTYWGFTMMEKHDRTYVKTLGLGQRFRFYDCSAELDYAVRSDDWNDLFSRESSLILKLAYEGRKWFHIHLKGGWEFVTGKESVMTPELDGPSFVGDYIVPLLLEPGKPFFFCGAYAYFYPTNKNKNLRLHLTAAANNYYQGAAINAGILYKFRFNF